MENRGSLVKRSWFAGEQLLQHRLAFSGGGIFDGHRQCVAGTDQHNHLLAARERRVEQFPIEHRILAFVDGNDDEGILAALAAMNRDGEAVRELRQ